MSERHETLISHFGDRAGFAISTRFVEQQDKYWFGNFRIWLEREPIGDWSDLADLSACARWVATYLTHRQDVPRVDVSDISESLLLYCLHGRHFAAPFPDVEPDERLQCGRLPASAVDEWRRYQLTQIGEASLMDQVALIAVPQPDDNDRILAYDFAREQVFSTVQPSSKFLEVLEGFLRWMMELMGDEWVAPRY